MTIIEIVAISSLGLNVVIAVVGATWGITKIKDAVRDAIDKHRQKYDDDLDSLGRSFGEGLSAIRQKVHDLETWIRDEFVRKASFEGSSNRMERTISDQFDKLEKRLERMEAKIDSKS